MWSESRPLPNGLILFNQRLLSLHCLSEKEARALWESIAKERGEFSVEEYMGHSDFEQSIAIANSQLVYCGLEIAAVAMKEVKENRTKLVRFYAMVNKYGNDEVAKHSFSHFSQHLYHYIGTVLQKLVADGPTSFNDLVNLRIHHPPTLSAATQDDEQVKQQPKTLSLAEADSCLRQLLADQWLEQQTSEETSHSTQTAKKRVTLAPRTYMELSHVLVDQFGFNKDDLPQQIYHQLRC
jgi:Nse1 non-SMC component of SMC5-6 complex